LQWAITLFRDVPAKEIQELCSCGTKFYRSGITAPHFHGHFSNYKQISQNYRKELNYNEK
jgi:hypothetical protein